MNLLDRLTADETIETAYQWLCDRRSNYHHNNDVWQLRRWRAEKIPELVAQLRAGTFRFREQRVVCARGERKEIWAARDALVLKALALVLGEVLLPHLSCFLRGLLHAPVGGSHRGRLPFFHSDKSLGLQPYLFLPDFCSQQSFLRVRLRHLSFLAIHLSSLFFSQHSPLPFFLLPSLLHSTCAYSKDLCPIFSYFLGD